MDHQTNEMRIFYRDAADLVPYARNAKKHPKTQVHNIAKSLVENGWRCPVLIHAGTGEIIAGHGRVLAAQEARTKRPELGQVPCIDGSDMDPEQIRKYRILDNKLNESEWDGDLLALECVDLNFSDYIDLRFELGPVETDDIAAGLEEPEDEDSEEDEEYRQFVEKFKPKKTTDDCYTPPVVFQAVVDWVAQEYGVDPSTFVRPFYPGGDYQNFTYPDGCVVVDNPPFSILSEILTFYAKKKIKFFLFAPTLTLFSSSSSSSSSSLAVGVPVTYENGAKVNTSFYTNLESCRFRSAPSLYAAIDAANKKNEKEQHKQFPKYLYPDEVLTAPALARFSKYGIAFKCERKESERIGELDQQKAEKKSIYGNGYLISEAKAKERNAAEKAAANAAEKAAANAAEKVCGKSGGRWELSEREKAIVRGLG